MSAGAQRGMLTGRLVLGLPLSGGTGVIGRCRDFTRAALDRWWPAPERDAGVDYWANEARSRFVRDVVLAVSEAVTNACMHTDGPTELVLDCTPERLRAEVVDPSPAPPVPRSPDPAQPGGHGLRVIESLSRAWGYEPRGTGKAVWLEIGWPPDIAGQRGAMLA